MHRIITIITIYLLIYFTNDVFSQINEHKDYSIENENYSFLKLENTALESGYRYHLQYATNQYLVYVEYYTQQVFLYNLNKQKVVYSKAIPKGKGPFEFTSITGAVIIDEFIYISSREELKIIEINIKNDKMKELRLEKTFVRDMSVYNNKILIENDELINLFAQYNIQKEEESFVKFSGFNPIKEFSHLFFKEGDFSIKGDNLYFVTTYLPFIYVFNLENQVLKEKIKFDISEVKKPRKLSLGNGDVAELPPESNFKIKEITAIPSNNKKVLIIIEGKGATRRYSFQNIYEYDLVKKKFSTVYPYHTEIRSIVSNDKHVFVNSFNDLAIYKLTIK